MRVIVVFFVALATSGCLIDAGDRDCYRARTCEVCLGGSGCGWCPSRGCVEGTSLGPDFGQCEDYSFSSCEAAIDFDDAGTPVRRCDLQFTYGACLEEGCVWCSGDEICTDDVSECSPPPPPDCSTYTTCQSCAADTRCGWYEEYTMRQYCDAPACDFKEGLGDTWCRDRTGTCF